MPAGETVTFEKKDVDGRDRPGHDELDDRFWRDLEFGWDVC